METEEHADPSEPRLPPRVRIVHLTAPVFRALANGDLAAANTASPVPLSAYFAGPEWRAVWRRRSKQVEEDPASAAWVTGVIWDERDQVAVGRAGYHGPPDSSGTVEIGYAVDPAYRRRGYARAALEALLQRAAREPHVHTVRVTIRPDNVASYQLASQYGFTQVGEQWDDEDGLEIIYELDARQWVIGLDRGWRTDRLNLEPLTAAHATELAPLLDDRSLHEFIGGAPLSAAALAARYARLAARRSPDGEQLWGNWVLRVRVTGEAAGTVQATLPAGGPAAGPAEVAWVIAAAAQGHGYAKEAARSLVAMLQAAGWAVVAYIHPGHLASQRVAQAAGLSLTTGIRDGEMRWASPDWPHPAV